MLIFFLSGRIRRSFSFAFLYFHTNFYVSVLFFFFTHTNQEWKKNQVIFACCPETNRIDSVIAVVFITSLRENKKKKTEKNVKLRSQRPSFHTNNHFRSDIFGINRRRFDFFLDVSTPYLRLVFGLREKRALIFDFFSCLMPSAFDSVIYSPHCWYCYWCIFCCCCLLF